ncbi:zinc finger, C2H2 type, partial [Ostertagia ostertagi]
MESQTSNSTTSEALRKQKRTRRLQSLSKEAYECDVCGLVYQSQKGLDKHKRYKGHNNEQQTVAFQRELSCSLCEERVKDHWQLIDHFNEEHATLEKQYIVETATFDDRASFQDWKTQLENDSVTRFAVVSRRKFAGGYVTYMRCSRARPTPAYGDVARPGSRKVVDSCTAFMKVTESGNILKVKFCRSHCGHEVEPAVLTIDPSSEQYIVSLLKEGFRPHQILKKIRTKCRDNDQHLRLYYTSYSDIRLIGIRNKVDPCRRDAVDIKSVEMRVREGAPDDGIRLYTPAVNETGEGFCL